jgi:hypothetical protein
MRIISELNKDILAKSAGVKKNTKKTKKDLIKLIKSGDMKFLNYLTRKDIKKLLNQFDIMYDEFALNQELLETLKTSIIIPSYHLVVDMSGSMFENTVSIIEGMKTYINDIKDGPNIIFKLIFFHTYYNIIYNGPIHDFNMDILNQYAPSYETALNDAIFNTLETTISGDTVVILTDGVENKSIKTIGETQTIITQKQYKNIKIMFLAANQDAIETGKIYGIPEDLCITFDTLPENIHGAFRSVSDVSRGISDSFTPTHRRQSSQSEDYELFNTPPIPGVGLKRPFAAIIDTQEPE